MSKQIAVVTPVLDDGACFPALVAEKSSRFTWVAAIEIIRLASNVGHQRAIAVGLCTVANRDDIDAVLIMDSDGEDRPIDIPALLAASQQHPAHVVLAVAPSALKHVPSGFGTLCISWFFTC